MSRSKKVKSANEPSGPLGQWVFPVGIIYVA